MFISGLSSILFTNETPEFSEGSFLKSFRSAVASEELHRIRIQVKKNRKVLCTIRAGFISLYSFLMQDKRNTLRPVTAYRREGESLA
jgi:hypothetical protein